MQSVTQAQLFKLLALHMFSTMIAFMLGIMIGTSGFNGPLGIFVGSLIGLAVTYASYRLGLRRPGRFFADYGSEIVGKWLHVPLVLFVAFANLMIAITNFWELQDFLIQFYLVDTPAWAISGMCGLCIAYTVRFGVQSVFRAAEGIFWISLCSFLLIPFLVGEHMNGYVSWGILTHANLREAWPAAYYTASVYGEMSYILFIFPYLMNQQKTMRSVTAAGFLSVTVVLLHVIPLLLIFGPDLVSNLNYPDLELLRFTRSGSFLETLDPALIALWLISIFVKLGFIVFIISTLLAQTCKIKDFRPFVFPITAFIAIGSLVVFQSNVQFQSALSGGLLTMFVLSELVPGLYYVVDSLRALGSKRKRRRPA